MPLSCATVPDLLKLWFLIFKVASGIPNEQCSLCGHDVVVIVTYSSGITTKQSTPTPEILKEGKHATKRHYCRSGQWHKAVAYQNGMPLVDDSCATWQRVCRCVTVVPQGTVLTP